MDFTTKVRRRRNIQVQMSLEEGLEDCMIADSDNDDEGIPFGPYNEGCPDNRDCYDVQISDRESRDNHFQVCMGKPFSSVLVTSGEEEWDLLSRAVNPSNCSMHSDGYTLDITQLPYHPMQIVVVPGDSNTPDDMLARALLDTEGKVYFKDKYGEIELLTPLSPILELHGIFEVGYNGTYISRNVICTCEDGIIYTLDLDGISPAVEITHPSGRKVLKYCGSHGITWGVRHVYAYLLEGDLEGEAFVQAYVSYPAKGVTSSPIFSVTNDPFIDIVMVAECGAIAVTQGGRVYVIGEDHEGALGLAVINGNDDFYSSWTHVDYMDGLNIVKAFGGGEGAALLSSTNTLYTSGHKNITGRYTGFYTSTDFLPIIGKWQDISIPPSSESMAIAIYLDGTLWAWGVSYNCQFGLDQSSASGISRPAMLSSDEDYIDVAVSHRGLFAIKDCSTIVGYTYVTGPDRNDHFGLGALIYDATDGDVVFTDWSTISTAPINILDLVSTEDNTFWVDQYNQLWGAGAASNNVFGFYVAPGSPSPAHYRYPTLIITPGPVSQVWACQGGTVILLTDYSIYVTGANFPCSDGTCSDWEDWEGVDEWTLVPNPTSSRLIQVAMPPGGIAAYFLFNNGECYVIGDNFYGALGVGYPDIYTPPVEVPAMAPIYISTLTKIDGLYSRVAACINGGMGISSVTSGLFIWGIDNGSNLWAWHNNPDVYEDDNLDGAFVVPGCIIPAYKYIPGSSNKFVDVYCSRKSSFAVSMEGEVFGAGKREEDGLTDAWGFSQTNDPTWKEEYRDITYAQGKLGFHYISVGHSSVTNDPSRWYQFDDRMYTHKTEVRADEVLSVFSFYNDSLEYECRVVIEYSIDRGLEWIHVTPENAHIDSTSSSGFAAYDELTGEWYFTRRETGWMRIRLNNSDTIPNETSDNRVLVRYGSGTWDWRSLTPEQIASKPHDQPYSEMIGVFQVVGTDTEGTPGYVIAMGEYWGNDVYAIDIANELPDLISITHFVTDTFAPIWFTFEYQIDGQSSPIFTFTDADFDLEGWVWVAEEGRFFLDGVENTHGVMTFKTIPAWADVDGYNNGLTDGILRIGAWIRGINTSGTDIYKRYDLGIVDQVNGYYYGYDVTMFAKNTDGGLYAWGDNPEEIGIPGVQDWSPAMTIVYGTQDIHTFNGASVTILMEYCQFNVLRLTYATWGLSWIYGDNTYNIIDNTTDNPAYSMLDYGEGQGQMYSGPCASHAVQVDRYGMAYLWGKNSHGQCGIPPTVPLSPDMGVSYNITTSTASCGAEHTLILKIDGTVWGCGRNDYGQLGLGHTDDVTEGFVEIGEGYFWKSISCGEHHSLLLRADGMLFGCGQNTSSELGLGGGAPAYVSILQLLHGPYTYIAAGKNYSIASGHNSETGVIALWGWGLNDYEQIGDNDYESGALITTPVLSDLSNIFSSFISTEIEITGVWAGGFHSFLSVWVSTENYNIAFCVGRNDYHQLGVSTASGIQREWILSNSTVADSAIYWQGSNNAPVGVISLGYMHSGVVGYRSINDPQDFLAGSNRYGEWKYGINDTDLLPHTWQGSVSSGENWGHLALGKHFTLGQSSLMS